LFQEALNCSRHPLSYNGDIFTKLDYKEFKKQYPDLNDFMIGRGILSNPFLPAEIKKIEIEGNKTDLLHQFHNRLFEKHLAYLEGDSHLLHKMLAFWEYFPHSFHPSYKVYKLIKKAKSRQKYMDAVQEIFRSYSLIS